jgi:hypothetical protein
MNERFGQQTSSETDHRAAGHGDYYNRRHSFIACTPFT